MKPEVPGTDMNPSQKTLAGDPNENSRRQEPIGKVDYGAHLTVPLTKEQILHLPSLVRDLASLGLKPLCVEAHWGSTTFLFTDAQGGHPENGPTATDILQTLANKPAYLLTLENVGPELARAWRAWGVRHG